MPRVKKDAIRTQMKLPPWLLNLAAIVGDNKTDGVERLFSILPVFYQVKLYLSEQSADGDDRAAALLHELEKLELDRVYEESVCEGIVVPGKDGDPVAWIV